MAFNQIDVFLFLLIWYSSKSSGCTEGWEGFLDDTGYPECFPCRKCPEGTTAVENCTKEHDTICDECTGDEYYHILSIQCKTCNVCDAGYYVRRNCSRFKDTACDVCPTGTFSLVQSSSTCKNCTDCREINIIKACSRTEDTVCEPIIGIQRVLLVVDIIISVVLLICCVIHACWHRGNNSNGDIQEMQALQGNSSCGAIEVNPNKKQTDKRYQRSETSEFTFEPDKELSVTDKEQRIKSSVSAPGEMHVRRHDMKIKYVRDIKVRSKSDEGTCDITGICVLDQDKVFLCDSGSDSVKLVDTKRNEIVSQISLPSEPWDTALVPRDVTEESTTRDLIVTMPGANSLRFIRVTNDQITDTNKVISVKGWCHGIQVTQDRKLAVSYDLPGKVEILDMDGQVLRSLETDHDGALLFDQPWYLAVSPGSGILYVSDWGDNTLTSISTRDWSVMTKLKGLFFPRGVTVDRAGSVFVCCGDGTVHLVAATGDRSTQILGKEDGLCEKPRVIGLSPEGDRMYVGLCKGPRAIGLSPEGDRMYVGLCKGPQAIGFSPEGDRMYVVGYSDHVQEFQLTEN